ncbi:major capsid protein P2 [Pseudoduganella namucuonensis]|uniref:Uncharacterized protein n=1 Tax=Pseudoduganella namucuonensis TaxID=1035707 RepID=A0A1I7LT42_9BURK|nr:major capsid protein P2 [Pseudoduganella namucuonensis]SFV12809.1 hypothetical protein SAMN05216552_10374 [Pseudoduganella namucuonensis]
MSSNYDQQIDLQNVVPGATAVLKLSYFATFDKIHLNLSGGLTKAHIGRIEGKANGVTFFVDDGSLIGIRDAYQGLFVDASVLTIDFTEPNTRGGAAAQYLSAVPRNLLASLVFEIEIKAAAPGGIVMKAEAEYREPTPNPFILRRKDFNVPLPNVGENDIMLPVAINGGLIKRIWLHAPNVTAVELRTNATPRIRAKKASIEFAQKRNRLVPQAGIIVLDFVADGNMMNMLNTAGVNECLLRLTTSAADTLKCYIDYVDDMKRLA